VMTFNDSLIYNLQDFMIIIMYGEITLHTILNVIPHTCNLFFELTKFHEELKFKI